MNDKPLWEQIPFEVRERWGKPTKTPETGSNVEDAAPYAAAIGKDAHEEIAPGIIYTKTVIHAITLTIPRADVDLVRQTGNMNLAIASQLVEIPKEAKEKHPELANAVFVTSTFMSKDHADQFVEAVRRF